MTPDEIRDFLGGKFPQLVPSPRRNPDGWSFFYEERRPGARILRATRSSAAAGTRLLLSISNRLDRRPAEFQFDRNEEQLRQLVAEEIRLYLKHFASAPVVG
jgi:hypothetical protein